MKCIKASVETEGRFYRLCPYEVLSCQQRQRDGSNTVPITVLGEPFRLFR